jgi:DNA repair exonuclease SbcCD nuclease subunit
MTHGDQFRGGSGISGIQTPLALGAFRKSKRQQAIDDPFDTMLLGHFHQYMTLPGMIVNGSLKGYDEYAMISNFGFEVPQQAFWLTTPERGPGFHVAIQPMSRKAEGW